jgi:NAD(P)-dependent dehydrogenase (short-subunit alcohol dehydrogenase family)
VNVIAPYLLTALIDRPERLIYMGSGMHRSGDPALSDPQWFNRPWNATQAYSDSKLHDLILSMAIASRWSDVLVNAVDPGWAPTRMGGADAPDDLMKAAHTQAWLAVSTDPAAQVSGGYFYREKQCSMHPITDEVDVQNNLIQYLKTITGVELDSRESL